ncbi:MAG: thioredoxin domain-containing protein [Deltaproteobacteria bacterium]|nr:thioredoxin domain-containing protein [Deltaproteobacteria bacterium]
MPNRLAQESSPYLKQHSENPVDWYAWSAEALERAKVEDKPILLSIGYSACHWCHVMEHECFENEDIARLMNENFVNIKVDREERPDLDQIYQNVAQLMTRSGGWPLTVFLTPDLRPYFGGTYFPPEDRHGRPGFPRVLTALSQAYKNDRANVAENARRLTEAIGQLEANQIQAEQNTRPTPSALRKICDAILGAVDWHNGGFGGAPKFPNTMNLTYLWRYGSATGFGMAQEAALLGLTRMAKGGIYDQLGGGFHRYSVDERWAVPHFEKMLYDNAVLVKLLAEVLLTGKDLSTDDRQLYTRVLAETTRYVLREMKAPEGAFYSTQDADSEGVEGKFFVWSPRALRQHLSEQEARVFELHYGVTDAGNFEGQAETVLFIAQPLVDVARLVELTPEKTAEVLAQAREKLFVAREARVRPGRDEKIIAGWNGLMISGLAWASRALRDSGQWGPLAEEASESALVAMNFVRTKMSQGQDRLWSVYKDGTARFNGYLDDYAFLAMGALDLARISEDETEVESLVAQARRWLETVRRHFTDKEGGTYFFTSDDHEKLIQRPKTVFDQAIPSGNAVLAQAFLALGELVAESDFDKAADELLYKLFPTLEKVPMGMGETACAALLAVAGPVTISGPQAQKACVHPHFFRKPGRQHELLVCHKRTCDMPLTDVESARALALKKIALRGD